MNRQEFIENLRVALSGQLPVALVKDHINYYEEYIRTEVLNGRSEREVLASLGDPRLIARTIISTNTSGDDMSEQEDTYGQNSYRSAHREKPSSWGNKKEVLHRSNVPGWVWGLVVILILVLVLYVVMSVLSFLAPVLLPAIVVIFLIKLFRDWLN